MPRPGADPQQDTHAIGTNVGDTTTPSGFAKISGFATQLRGEQHDDLRLRRRPAGQRVALRHVHRRGLPGCGHRATHRAGHGREQPAEAAIHHDEARDHALRRGLQRDLLRDRPVPRCAATSRTRRRWCLRSTWLTSSRSTALKDTGADVGNLRDPAAKLVQQVMSVIDANNRTISNNGVDWSTQNGWYVDLNPANDSPGERVNIDTQLVRGVLLVVRTSPTTRPARAAATASSTSSITGPARISPPRPGRWSESSSGRRSPRVSWSTGCRAVS